MPSIKTILTSSKTGLPSTKSMMGRYWGSVTWKFNKISNYITVNGVRLVDVNTRLVQISIKVTVTFV